jgi:CBS-domain-containing membrane protein
MEGEHATTKKPGFFRKFVEKAKVALSDSQPVREKEILAKDKPKEVTSHLQPDQPKESVTQPKEAVTEQSKEQVEQPKEQVAEQPQALPVDKDIHKTFLSKELVTLDHSYTVQQALGTMRKRKLYSVPIVDRKKEEKVLGILNMTDLWTALLFQEFEKYKSEPQLLKDIGRSEFDTLLKTSILNTKAESLLNFTQQTSWFEGDEDTSMETMMEMLAKGIRQFIVKKKNGKQYIVSQWDLIRFFKEHEQQLGDIMNMPISELGLVSDPQQKITCVRVMQDEKAPTTMTMDESALVGFQRLWTLGWDRALPVMDRSGDIVASLSPCELRGLTEHNYQLLLLPVLDYIREVSGGFPRPTICVRPNSSMSEVIKKIVYAHVHGVWVMDDYKVMGPHCVTLTDIIRKFSPYDWDTYQEMHRKRTPTIVTNQQESAAVSS